MTGQPAPTDAMQQTSMTQRDLTLDYMKGAGCMLMVLSHSIVQSAHRNWLFAIVAVAMFLGWLAPVLFFSVSGVVNALQAKRRPLGYFITFGLLFAVLGLTYNGIWRTSIFQHSDIPQIIAWTIIVTVLVEQWSTRATVGYLTVAGVLAVLHFGVAPLLPDFPGRAFLLVPLGHDGVFPPIPWLILPMLGNVAYRASDQAIRRTATVLLACTLVLLVVTLTNLGGITTALHLDLRWFWMKKFSMPFGYFLLMLTALFLAFAAFRQWGHRIRESSIFVYVGRNSFPFLYLHLMYIRAFQYFQLQYDPAYLQTHFTWCGFPLIVWPAVLGLTIGSVMLLDRLNKALKLVEVFSHPAPWIAYAALLAVALFAWPGSETVVAGQTRVTPTVLMYALGLLFAYEFRGLAAMVKRWFTPDHSSVPVAVPATGT